MLKKCMLLALCLSSSLLSAQIREYVCIVRPVYSEQTLAFTKEAGQKLIDIGYRDIGQFWKNNEAGGFGSGFLFSGAGGENYIVTNRHVVADAVSANISFENSDGSFDEYPGSIVVAVDVELDLALIHLKSGALAKKGLLFAVKAPSDGDDIWSAGYPGLVNNPSWQLGKGTITNATSRVPILVDPSRSTLIQHSAPVDPGNSGGPLLVVNKGKPGGYEVVGINTWKASFRQATNLALPAATIQKFIDRNIRADSKADTRAALTARIADLCAVSAIKIGDDKNERIRRIARFLSLEYVTKAGNAALPKALQKAPPLIRGEVLDSLQTSSLLEAMRLACAWEIDGALTKAGLPVVLAMPESVPTPASDGTVPLKFNLQDSATFDTTWKMNLDSWEINDSEATNNQVDAEKKTANKNKSKGVSFSESVYANSLGLEYRKMPDLTVYGVQYIVNGPFYAMGVMASSGKMTYTDEYYASQETTSSLVAISALFRLQCSIATDRVTILPYAEGRAGMRVVADGVDQSGGYSGYGLGAQFVFGSEMKLILTAGWCREGLESGEKVDGYSLALGIGM